MPKSISSPHVSAFASIGSASQIALAVAESFSSAAAEICPAVMRIARAIEPSLGSASELSQGRTRGSWRVDGLAVRERGKDRGEVLDGQYRVHVVLCDGRAGHRLEPRLTGLLDEGNAAG